MSEKNNKKDLEIITGDGNNLDISPVYEHLKNAKPKSTKNKPKNVVIPKTKKENKE